MAADRRPADLPGAVRRFGWQAGADGWPLHEIARWVEALADSGGALGAERLLTFDAGMALSAGWADGFLHGADQDDCIDPTSGSGAARRPPAPPAPGLRPLRVARHPARPRLRARRGRRLAGRAPTARAQRGPGGAGRARPGSSSPPARPSPSTTTACWCWPAARPSWPTGWPSSAPRCTRTACCATTPSPTWVERLPTDAADLRAFLDRPDGLSGHRAGRPGLGRRRQLWTQTGMPERHEVGRPDEVHGRGAHPHAAVAGRVVRDVVRAVDGDAAPEVLGPVELAELTLPPAFGPLPVDLVQPVGRLGVALQDLARAPSCSSPCTRCPSRSTR